MELQGVELLLKLIRIKKTESQPLIVKTAAKKTFFFRHLAETALSRAHSFQSQRVEFGIHIFQADSQFIIRFFNDMP